VYQSARNQLTIGMMPSVLNTDPWSSSVYQNVTSVPNVPTVPNVPKWPWMIPVCQKAAWCTNKTTTNTCTIATGVPNVKHAKVPKLTRNNAHCPVYQNATGVLNVTTVTNVPKMTNNDASVFVFGSVHFYMGFWKNPFRFLFRWGAWLVQPRSRYRQWVHTP